MVHTGPRRVDDRRVISGIVRSFREGCRWRTLPPEYGPYTTVFNRWSQRGLWPRIFATHVACADPPQVTLIDSSAVKAHRSAAGAKKGGDGDACHQAIGRSRRAHCQRSTASATSKAARTRSCYDANHLRRFLAERGTAAVIPSTSSRKIAIPHDPERYKLRNVIKRTFCRIKDFYGIATRYDKTSRNFSPPSASSPPSPTGCD
jgi:transposase